MARSKRRAPSSHRASRAEDSPLQDPFLPLAKSGIRPGLARIRRLLRRLENPERRLRTVLVAGSNGKGTTAAMLEAMLRAAGFRTGLFTSPHLVSVTERFRLDGACVEPGELVHFMRRHEAAIRRTEATYFEATTACALWLFARTRVDWAILEIGLGGRWDACNAVEPDVAIVTSISREHTEYLGTTEAAIAREKAQVARPGKPVIVGRVSRAARASLNAEFRTLGAVPYWLGKDFEVTDSVYGTNGVAGTLRAAGRTLCLRSAIRGKHALDNAALAACALGAIASLATEPLPARAVRRAIVTGARNVRWPGRLEVVSRRPLVVLDVAHNAGSFRALAEDWRRHWPGVRPIVVVGLLADKPAGQMAGALEQICDSAIATRAQSPRAVAPSTLTRLLERRIPQIESIDSVEGAVRRAFQLAGRNGAILVCGSHFVVGPARAALLAVPGRGPH